MTTNKIAGKLLAAAGVAFALMIVPSFAVHAEDATSIYVVEKNDCLSGISKKLTGTEDYWQDIYNANSAVVKKNYVIYTGQQLIIPASVNYAIAAQTPVALIAPAAPAAPEVTVPAVPTTQKPYTGDPNENPWL